MYNKFQQLILFFVLLMFCSVFFGCDSVYRMLDKEGAQEKDLIGEVIPFEKNLVVEEIQALLYLYGYNTGKVDGALGLRTRNAIEKFQKDNNLKQSRFVDEATWNRLNKFRENKLVIKQQLNIKLVQEILEKEGFNPGGIDGKMGVKTKDAVMRFQKAHDLKVDGKVGYQTLSKLAEFIPDQSQIEQ